MCSVPAPAWEGCQAAEAARVRRGTIVLLSLTKNNVSSTSHRQCKHWIPTTPTNAYTPNCQPAHSSAFTATPRASDCPVTPPPHPHPFTPRGNCTVTAHPSWYAWKVRHWHRVGTGHLLWRCALLPCLPCRMTKGGGGTWLTYSPPKAAPDLPPEPASSDIITKSRAY